MTATSETAVPGVAPSSPEPFPNAEARTYQVRTYGCQMNVHDSERLSGPVGLASYRSFIF